MVTRYLAQMERWAGARLLHRTTRRLSLTAAGEQALARCRGMLAFAADMPALPADDASPVRGLLRVACAQSLAEVVLAAIEEERFLILPHPEVQTFVQRKAGDHERWLAGMRKLQARFTA